MSFWDKVIKQIKVGQILFTPGREIEGRNGENFFSQKNRK